MVFVRSVLAVMLLGTSPAAIAQVATQDKATTPEAQVADPGGDDIIVTGEKANRTLQDTPARA
ncbi:hypothetical protein EWE75_23050 [Sphingomonas populi]|uniref:TonB-dependent receptor n=1 Tax=Sphingomonas populi TaxID=2484750 RepID=A0A4Q6XHT2_9SPHN|nr:hypothetical protein [Sphingomonas populi]RZF59183.1 hypothetical protein EWE75_23050 [Sphingomonas populi]